MRKLQKFSLQNLSQNEIQRRQAKALTGGKDMICVCSVECSAMCSCTYTQTLSTSRIAIMVHPVTNDNSNTAGNENRDSTVTHVRDNNKDNWYS